MIDPIAFPLIFLNIRDPTSANIDSQERHMSVVVCMTVEYTSYGPTLTNESGESSVNEALL